MEDSHPVKFTWSQVILFMGFELILLLMVFFLGGRFGATLFQNSAQVASQNSQQELAPVENKNVNKLTSEEGPLDEEDRFFEVEENDYNINVKAEQKEKQVRPQTALGKSNAVIRVKGSSSDIYAVELQTFEDEVSAAASLSKWKSKGHQPYIVIERMGENKLYKIRVGNFGNKNKAIELANQIQDKEGILTQVVQSE